MSESMAQEPEYNIGRVILISIVATIGGFLFGFDSGVINGTVDGLQQAFNSDSVGTGFNVASMLLGCAAGAFFAGRLADLWGRRTLLIISAFFFIISAWGSGISTGSFEFIIYRIFGGLAVGAASVISPAYIGEISPAHIRGRLITAQQIAIITGLFCAFVSNYFLAEAAGSSLSEFWLGYTTWRWMFWIELIPAVTFFLALFSIPESPRYLVVQRRKEEAEAVLTKIFNKIMAPRIVNEIDNSLAKDHHKPKLSDVIDKATGRVRTIVWVGITLAAFQQFSGINVVFYYGAVLWQAVGFSESDALLINIISGGVSIGACVATVFMIDKIGRKPLLKYGSLGMAIALGTVGGVFTMAGTGADGSLVLTDGQGVTALIAANLYVIMFNMTWGPIVWVLMAEMFPNQIRGSGLALSGLSMWVSNFIITITFPILLTSIGLGLAYSIYATFAAISFIFVIKMVKETKGIELEKMEG
jgi:MFS transporter, SP family, sugar:H+ symporter